MSYFAPRQRLVQRQPAPTLGQQIGTAARTRQPALTAAGEPVLQRQADPAPPDKHDLTAPTLAGDSKLEQCFDGDFVVKAPETGPHVSRLQTGLVQLGFSLPQFGVDAAYGPETARAVQRFQAAAGMPFQEIDGRMGKKTIGLLDRSLRNGTVAPDEDRPDQNDVVHDKKRVKDDKACEGKPTDELCPVAMRQHINTEADTVIRLIDKTVAEQLPPQKTAAADYPTLFNRIFRFGATTPPETTVAQVKVNFLRIRALVNALKTDSALVRCATPCDGGCRAGSPAYHRGGIVSFCPDFDKHPDRTLIVLHESHHASVPGSSDKAYRTTRLFTRLDPALALLNAESFHVYAAWVNQPGSQPVGPPVPDTNTISDAAERDRVAEALAHLEQWFALIPFDTSVDVQGISEASQTGHYKQRNAEIRMEQIYSRWFGMTRPPAAPNAHDVQRMRAIDERMRTMSTPFDAPLTIRETTGPGTWQRGPGQELALNTPLRQLPLHQLITALTQELVHATPNISADLESMYVLTINDMRTLRGLAP